MLGLEIFGLVALTLEIFGFGRFELLMLGLEIFGFVIFALGLLGLGILGLEILGLGMFGLEMLGLGASPLRTTDWLRPLGVGDPPIELICTTFTVTEAWGLVDVTKTLRDTEEYAGMEMSKVMS